MFDSKLRREIAELRVVTVKDALWAIVSHLGIKFEHTAAVESRLVATKLPVVKVRK